MDSARLDADTVDYELMDEVTVAMGKFAPTASSMWYLTGKGDETAAFRYAPLSPLPFRIGRRSDLSLCLPFPAVSNVHAEIVESDGRLILRDLGSTNGTFANGSRVQQDTVLQEGDLIQFANVTFRLNREVNAVESQTVVVDVGDDVLALTRFDDLMNDRAVVPHFQPIVSTADGTRLGYEVLGRSRLFGLKSPQEMFRAAAQLNLQAELSRMLRAEGIRAGMKLEGAPPLFVNTHPLELTTPGDLYASLIEVRKMNEQQPLTLEIHESAVLQPVTMKNLRAVLQSLDITLGYDDFGAGQARLIELVEVVPDYLKFDMKLVQNIHKASDKHQQMVATLVRMCSELGIAPLAEGIETKEDADTCHQLGFQLGQGFFYGKPKPLRSVGSDDD